MSRVGWILLATILLALGAFVSTCSIGTAPPTRVGQALPVPDARGLLVPVAGVARAALRDGWGDPRDGGARAHRGLDIAAPGGTPVLAAGAGTVEKLFRSARGGMTVYIRSHDRRWIHYYAHLAGYAAGMVEGRRVQAGDVIGRVGDTGDAGAGNFHLHFGAQRMRAGEQWWQGEDVNPWPLLAGRAQRR